MMIGRIALSSKLPWAPAAATIESSPITWRHTITIASCWVGLTLPGMIEEPGSFAGSMSSCRPARGPEASQRMSLAIFMRATATPRRPALTATIASSEPCAANLFGAVLSGRPVSSASLAATSSPYPRGRVQARADGGAADRQLVTARPARSQAALGHRAAGRPSPTTPDQR